MKTLAVFLLLAGSASACGVSVHHAAVIVESPFIVTQFATSVGVPTYAYPVAQGSPYTYSTNGGYVDSGAIGRAVEAGVSRALAKAGQQQPLAARATSLVAQNCASCHSGPNPKGGLDLSNLEALDDATRLKAAHAVLSDTMPKGKPISDPNVAGKLLLELSAPSKVAVPPTPDQSYDLRPATIESNMRVAPGPPKQKGLPHSNALQTAKTYTVPESLPPEQRPAPAGWTTSDGGKSWQSPPLVGSQKMYTQVDGKWVEDKDLAQAAPPVPANP